MMVTQKFCIIDGQLTDPQSGKLIDLSEGSIGTISLKRGKIQEKANPYYFPNHTEVLLQRGDSVHLLLKNAKSHKDELYRINRPLGRSTVVTSLAARAILQEDVIFQFHRDRRTKMLSASVALDHFPGLYKSLNHAYTAASERYETERTSHTGNVFEHVYVKTESGYFRCLQDYRAAAIQGYNERLIRIAEFGINVRQAIISCFHLGITSISQVDNFIKERTQFSTHELTESDVNETIKAILAQYARKTVSGHYLPSWRLSVMFEIENEF